MKNKKLYWLYGIFLITAQFGIVKMLGSHACLCGGFGFYPNAVFLFIFFAIRFITTSFAVSFYAEYFYQQDGLIYLLRIQSRQKTYFKIITHIFFLTILFKALSQISYLIFTIIYYKSISFHDFLISLSFDLLTCLIFYSVQVYVEIRFGAKVSLLLINSAYLVLTIIGSVFNEYALQGNTTAMSLNRYVIANYLYLERIKELNSSYPVSAFILLFILILIIIASNQCIKNIDVLGKER